VLNGSLNIESIQLTRGDAGTQYGTIWFDDLRIAERIIATDLDDEAIADLPTGFELEQNYPNPFNPSTSIGFSLPEAADVTIEIYSITGQKITDLVSSTRYQAGRHVVNFDASRMASGTYIYRMRTANQELSRKMVLIK
jgi:hypothetical protein